MTDHEFAAIVALLAGDLLLRVRDRGGNGALGELESNVFLANRIRRHYPDDGLLCEETCDEGDWLRRDRVWVIDPLDGTHEFEEGRRDWAVHVALVERGTVTAAAVGLPASERVITMECAALADRASGTFAVCRAQPPAFAPALAAMCGAKLVEIGSPGYKVGMVVLGEADAYVDAGGLREWDVAAPTGVAAAAGLHVSRIDGSPLRFNQPDAVVPDLLICRPELAPRLLSAIAELTSGHGPGHAEGEW